MADINNELNKIKNAVYGKEVRQSIHDAIKECYKTASVDHDNANMEVTMSRGTFNTLYDRLDNHEMNISEKMNKNTNDISISQINKNKGKIDQTYLTDELLQQITGNTPVNAIPADNSITNVKLVDRSVNGKKVDEHAINIEHLNKSIFYNNSIILENVTIPNDSNIYAIAQIDLESIRINKPFNIELSFNAQTDNENVVSISNEIFINNNSDPKIFDNGDIIPNILITNFTNKKLTVHLNKEITTQYRYLKLYFKIISNKFPIKYNINFNDIKIKINNIQYKFVIDCYTINQKITYDFYGNTTNETLVNNTMLNNSINNSMEKIINESDKKYVEKMEDYTQLKVEYKYKDNVVTDNTKVKHLFIMYDIGPIISLLNGTEKFKYNFNISQSQTGIVNVHLFNNNNDILDNFEGGANYINLTSLNVIKDTSTEVAKNNIGSNTNQYRYVRLSIEHVQDQYSEPNLTVILNNLSLYLGEYNLTPYIVDCNIYKNSENSEYCRYSKVSLNNVVRKKELIPIQDDIEELKKANNLVPIKDDIKNLQNDISQLKTTINLTDFKLPKYRELSQNNYGFIGRWFEKEFNGIKHYVTINQGSEFYFKVKDTTSISLLFKVITVNVTPFFAYSIDGSEFTRQKITDPLLPRVTNDEHIVRIIIDGLTETEDKWNGEIGVAFEKATVDNGGIITGILPTNREIIFFGDSITEGIRVLNMEANSNGNSASGAFPFRTCENLNAISIRVGFGASGVTKGGSGGVPKCLEVIDNMTSLRKAPYVEPDIVVLNHGTNDAGASSEIFEKEYNLVLERLKIKFPGIPVFAMIPFYKTHTESIRNCVKGKSWVYLVETKDWNVSCTDGYHPDIAGGITAGKRLSEEIIKVLGKDYFIK